jgi:hypothetical protein
VPNFPEPLFPAQGGVYVPTLPGVNSSSPAFKAAAQTCSHVGIELPGGG